MTGKNKRKILSFLLCLFLILGVVPAFSAVYATGNSGNNGNSAGDFVGDEIIIAFHDVSLFPGKEAQYDSEVMKVMRDGLTMVSKNVYVVKSAEFQKNPNATLNKYKNSEFIEYAEPNAIMKTDLIPTEANYKVYQAGIAGVINAPAGWDIVTSGGPVMAVVDSGVVAHPDLPALVPGFSAVTSLATNNDKLGHGTQVAGTLGAIGNNGKGGAGMNWNAKIMPVKVDDAAGTMSVANVAKGIRWAADNGAKIINMSLGSKTDSITLKDACDYAYNKGCALFAASGNSGVNGVEYPARYASVIACGATSNGTARATISNYGAGLDVMAVGSYYTTTAAGGYANVAGTSFATPQVAGLASLIWAVNPNMTNEQLYNLLRDNTRGDGSGFNQEMGYGTIDMGKTLAAAQGDVAEPEPEPEPEPAAPPPPQYTLPPTIKLNGTEEIRMNAGDEYVESGFEAIDCFGVDMTSSVRVVSNLNTAVPGVYTIDYEVMDAGGNTARMTRTVIVTEAEIERPEPGDPILTPVGSNPIILHLGGTAYTEQGATAVDETDGNISGAVDIIGTPDTSKAGTYTVAYKVKNSLGKEVTATREVRVLAPAEQVARQPYGFTGQGKIPTTISHKNVVADDAGFMDLKVSKLDNKMSITVKLVDPATKTTVLTEKFSAVGSKQFNINAGKYDMDVTIDAGNGNCSYKVDLLMPEVKTFSFAEAEVPLDSGATPPATIMAEEPVSASVSTSTFSPWMISTIVALVVIAIMGIALARRSIKREE